MASIFDQEDNTPSTPIRNLEKKLDEVILPGGSIKGIEKTLIAATTPQQVQAALEDLAKTTKTVGAFLADEACDPDKKLQDFNFKDQKEEGAFKNRRGEISGALNRTTESIAKINSGIDVNDKAGFSQLKTTSLALCKIALAQGNATSSLFSGVGNSDNRATIGSAGLYLASAAQDEKSVATYVESHPPLEKKSVTVESDAKETGVIGLISKALKTMASAITSALKSVSEVFSPKKVAPHEAEVRDIIPKQEAATKTEAPEMSAAEFMQTRAGRAAAMRFQGKMEEASQRKSVENQKQSTIEKGGGAGR